MEKEVLGNFIAESRKELGLTQQALADRLHVTNTAVSKWERGLSYPDLAMLEPLANALNMTVSELMACKRNSESPAANTDEPMRSVLDIAHAASKKQRKKFWILAVCSVLCAVLIIALLWKPEPEAPSTSATESRQLCFIRKDMRDDSYYIYTEYYPDPSRPAQLLCLRCPDQAIWEDIVANDKHLYSCTYTLDTLTFRGTLESCELTDPYGAMRLEDQIGSITSFGSLFGVQSYMKYITISPNHSVPIGSYYTVEFYDYEESTISENGIEGTPFLTLYNICGAENYDYDNDGIYELVVKTKYENFPYMIYDLIDGEIVSFFIDESQYPLKQPLIWP